MGVFFAKKIGIQSITLHIFEIYFAELDLPVSVRSDSH